MNSGIDFSSSLETFRIAWSGYHWSPLALVVDGADEPVVAEPIVAEPVVVELLPDGAMPEPDERDALALRTGSLDHCSFSNGIAT